MPAGTSQISTPALTCLYWSAGGGGWGGDISTGLAPGRVARISGHRGRRSAPGPGGAWTGCSRALAAFGVGSLARRGGTSTGRDWTSGWCDGTLSRGTKRVSVRPGPITASTGTCRLASKLASAVRTTASADFWLRGSFAATLVSVFVWLRGGKTLASLLPLGASFGSGPSCGA